MKNKFLSFFIILFVSKLFVFSVNSTEQFNFDVTEIEILQNGDVIKGVKKGTINTPDGITITANTFIYDKSSNILTATGNVKVIDSIRDLKIYSDNVVYDKNKEVVTTNKNSKAVYGIGKFIFADNFLYNRNENILNAQNNVKIEDVIENNLIIGEDFTYFKNSEKIISNGQTKAFIQSKYKFVLN